MSDLRPRGLHNIRLYSILALLALLATTGLVDLIESRFAFATPTAPFQIQTYAAANESWIADDPRIKRTLRRDKKSFSAEYGFVSFQNDPIEVEVTVPDRAYLNYRQSFGYRQHDLNALFEQYKQNLEEARIWAVKNRTTQKQLDRVAAGLGNNYQRDVATFLKMRGFRFLSEGVIAADIPQHVKNNASTFLPVAFSLSKTIRLLKYSETDTIATVLPLLQTAIRYEALPAEENGKITAGFSPPLEVFMEGRGDCDAKSALLAAILLNWDKVKLVGVGMPGHYLLGILQHPGRGDAYVEYDGLTYVLMEPSGPAWLPPGVVSDFTLKKLGAHDLVIIEPLTL